MTRPSSTKATIFTHSRAIRFVCKCGYEKTCQTDKESDIIVKLHKKICSAAAGGKPAQHTFFSRHDGDKGHLLIDKDREDSYEELRYRKKI